MLTNYKFEMTRNKSSMGAVSHQVDDFDHVFIRRCRHFKPIIKPRQHPSNVLCKEESASRRLRRQIWCKLFDSSGQSCNKSWSYLRRVLRNYFKLPDHTKNLTSPTPSSQRAWLISWKKGYRMIAVMKTRNRMLIRKPDTTIATATPYSMGHKIMPEAIAPL